MKNLIIKLSLIAALVVACNTATAFTDNTSLYVLMHCDETNQAAWLTTPDDNSSGRAANEPILDMAIGGLSSTIDVTTQPIMTPGSPKGGEYFAFDGVNDSIICDPGWRGGDNAVCDFSFKCNTLPGAGDFDGLVTCQAFSCFLWGAAGPAISVMVEQNVMIFSPVVIAADTWYDVQVSIINPESGGGSDVSITVNGSTYTEHAGWALPGWTGPMTMGYFLRDSANFLDGDMDEIRVGNIPEPFTFGLIGLLGLLVLRKK